MQLPSFQTSDRILSMMITQWRAILNPVLASPLTNPRIINNITLKVGPNVINHGLQQIQQGWIIVDQTASSMIYRSAPLNELTLTLTASAVCNISLLVF
jgi:hypothetical protein